MEYDAPSIGASGTESRFAARRDRGHCGSRPNSPTRALSELPAKDLEGLGHVEDPHPIVRGQPAESAPPRERPDPRRPARVSKGWVAAPPNETGATCSATLETTAFGSRVPTRWRLEDGALNKERWRMTTLNRSARKQNPDASHSGFSSAMEVDARPSRGPQARAPRRAGRAGRVPEVTITRRGRRFRNDQRRSANCPRTTPHQSSRRQSR